MTTTAPGTASGEAATPRGDGVGLPEKIGPYDVVRRLGAGGMGEVYEGYDDRLDRPVALKCILKKPGDRSHARSRLRHEARAVARLSHPAIVQVYDWVETGDGDWIVMELVAGCVLQQLLAGGPLSSRRSAHLARDVAAGLAVAHAAGIVHRDLKASNVMVTPSGAPDDDHTADLSGGVAGEPASSGDDPAGGAKILDFGVAKRLPRGSGPLPTQLTQEGALIGSVQAMSPEQAYGDEIDHRSDLFSLGILLYQMATGKMPFTGTSQAQILTRICLSAHTPAIQVEPQVQLALSSLIDRLLEKEPAQRPQSAGEVVAALDAFLGSSEGSDSAPATVSETAPTTPAGDVAGPAIAVLPFVDMSPGKDQEYFSDGLTDELIMRFGKKAGLRVVGRTSAFQYKGTAEDLRSIGEKLNVTAILEGSVRRAGDRLRINVQLVDVGDGFHLWSESYQKQLGDIFAVQDDIAHSVVEALEVTLLGTAEKSRIQMTDPKAYTAYLQGRYFFDRQTDEDVKRSVSYFEEAVEIDPSYAPAWAGLAFAHMAHAGLWTGVPLREGFEAARVATRRALAIDDSMAEAWAARASIQMRHDWNWREAELACRRALSLAPGRPAILNEAAILAATLGRLEEAREYSSRAIESDPLNASAHILLGLNAYLLGRVDQAIAALDKTLELSPGFPIAHALKSWIRLRQGQPTEALKEAELEVHPLGRLQGVALALHALGKDREADAVLGRLVAAPIGKPWYGLAQIHAFRGEADPAFEWLEKARTQRDPFLSHLIVSDPLLADLRTDPRLTLFLEGLELPVRPT